MRDTGVANIITINSMNSMNSMNTVTSINANNSIRTQTSPKEKSISWGCSQVSTSYNIDMFKTDVHELWYIEQDYQAFRKDCKDTVNKIKHRKANFKGLSSIGSCLCRRGLEDKIYKEIGNRRRMRRQVAINTVLQEQFDQRQFGTHSPEFISELYQEISSPCQQDAYVIGLQDEKEAHAYREKSDTNLMKMPRGAEESRVESIKPLLACYSSSINCQSTPLKEFDVRCCTPRTA